MLSQVSKHLVTERRKVVGFLKERAHGWSQMFSVFTNNVRREV